MSDETREAVSAVHGAIGDHDYSRLTDDDAAFIAAAVLRWAAERSRDMSDTCGCGCGCGMQLDADADEITREQRDVIADPGT